ncbi:helix-turn-helix domain-containing protein [Prauserella alba]|uniref:Helix-turn-helix transcriptional regulator n=1 Tax=Prauserella alba TaxID=176898 RepID=A0ABP4FM98_9PSEU|nr:helix-turn-helix transcriptional regulator [Prauserella alba]MCP2178866.1 Helix-turn-helix domain-containing protein [Prauserella alba]
MTHSLREARQALGQQLRDLRKDAELTGRGLADLAGWHSSKVSKIEYGKQTPSEADVRLWCRYTSAESQIPDLIAAVRNIESMYVEWRRMLSGGTRRRQHASRRLEANTKLMRWYEPVLVPGILHTAEYATAVMRRVIDFYGIPDDLDAGVAERMERQTVLYRGDHRFHFILAQQALTTMVGDVDTMIGQLDRLLAVMSLPRVVFGIVPHDAEYRAPTNQFILFDNRLVHVETISAELTISQPREVALYRKAFDELAEQAVTGTAARTLITDALDQFHHAREPR